LHWLLLRYTMAHQFLAHSNNDHFALAQLLGHENLNTTARYTKLTQNQSNEAREKLNYCWGQKPRADNVLNYVGTLIR
jgi:site-specific recombinase XerD